MNFKRIFSAVMVVIMLIAVMCSCKKNPSAESSGYYDVSYITTTIPGEKKDNSSSENTGTENTGSGSKDSGNTSGSNGNVASIVDVSATKGRFDVDLSGKTIKLLLGYTPSDYEQEIYDQFCAKTGAKIKYISAGNKIHSEKLVALVAANDAPDATIMIAGDNFPNFITRNLVQPITSYLKESDNWVAWDLMNATKYNGEYYGVTDKTWGDSFYVYYNKDIVENDINVKKTPKQLYEAGQWTWDAFYDIAKTLTKKDSSNKIIQYGCTTVHLDVFMLSAGASLTKYENNKFVNTINTTAMKDASNMWRNLIKDSYMLATNSQSQWSSGKSAMNIYPQYILRQSLNSKMTKSWAPFNWDVVPFPSYTNGKSYEPTNLQFGVVPVKAKNPEAGFLVMLYRAYCQGNYLTLKNENANMVEMYKKTVNGPTYYSLDKSVVGTGAFKDLQDPSVSLQTAIDSWSPKIDGKIAEFEKEQSQYNFSTK